MGRTSATLTMKDELLAVLEYWEREKGVPKAVLIAAVEEALVAAAKKSVGPARDLRVSIDPKTGVVRAFAKLVVAEKVLSKHDQITLGDARRIRADAEIAQEVEIEVTPAGFGRIAAQYAKQAILMQVRKYEKELIFKEFRDRVGEIVSGIVRRFERSDVRIDLGKYEAVMPNRERVPTEEYQIGDRVSCFVKSVDIMGGGPEIILSRADPQFVIKLFRREVSEVSDGTVEIKSIAREPGFRTKLAVYSRDEKVDPVGACVGLRGQRVKNIVRELNNEKVDIIRWDPNIKVYLANALAPAKLKSFEVNEASRRVKVIVSEDQLSLAIGKRGQNARLTSRLTGWQVDIDAEHVVTLGFDEKVAAAATRFATILAISPEHAMVLVKSGFHTLEDLLQADVADLESIPQLTGHAASIMDAARAVAARGTEPPAEPPKGKPDET